MNTPILKRKAKAVISAALSLCVILTSFCACASQNAQKYNLEEEVIYSDIDTSLSSTQKVDLEEICSSGITYLFLDKNTYSPLVKNKTTVWRALPSKISPDSQDIPSVVSLEVMCGGQRYILSSQPDAVKHQAPTVTKTENGVCVEYVFTLSAQKETVTIKVPVEFYLDDGSFFVSINCENIAVSNEDYIITKLDLMEYFGSDTGASDGDYILVPDNCGAIINTYKAKELENKSFKVYGDEKQNNALLGVFGMKKSTSAFVAVIEDGDTISTVNADIAASSGYNRVGAQFELTHTLVKETKNAQQIFVSGESYKGTIKMCYRFIEGNKADYSGMAIACREHLIRTGVLPADTVDSSMSMPFILTVLGQSNVATGKTAVLTNYEQLLDMLTHLKGKGFSNIFVNYKGTFTGGLNPVTVSRCELLKSLGTKQQLKELTDYISAQQMTLFFDINLTSCAFASEKRSCLARDLSSALYGIESVNAFSGVSKTGLTAYDKIDNNVISIFELSQKIGISNISLSDAASFLYSDDAHGASRTDMAQKIKNETASLSTIGEVMVQKGNFYMINNASLVSSLPLTVSTKETSSYKAVPFVPLLLHGTVSYSSEPLNLSENYEKAILKCVEYGALPQFEWCYEVPADNTAVQEPTDQEQKAADGEEAQQESDDKSGAYSYAQWATAAYTFYEKANKALSDIRGERMTAHYQVKTGVYCTEYGDTNIYVNYTSKDVTVGGVTVPANDFMRVN